MLENDFRLYYLCLTKIQKVHKRSNNDQPTKNQTKGTENQKWKSNLQEHQKNRILQLQTQQPNRKDHYRQTYDQI